MSTMVDKGSVRISILGVNMWILIDHYATSGQIAVHDQIRELKEFVSSPSHNAKLMTTAEYQLKEKRQRQNRRSTTAITSTVSFVQARKVALVHVTRHVGVRLASLFSDWKDRHSWIDRSQLSKSDNIRQRVGVSAYNYFLFAYTGASCDGAVGYNDMQYVFTLRLLAGSGGEW